MTKSPSVSTRILFDSFIQQSQSGSNHKLFAAILQTSPYPYKVYEKTKYVSRSLVYCHDPTSVYPNKAQILLYISFLCWTCYQVFLGLQGKLLLDIENRNKKKKKKYGVNIFDNYYRDTHYQVICYLRKLRATLC